MAVSELLSAAANVVGRATLADWLLLSAALLLLLYVVGTWKHNHFRGRGIPQADGLWPFLGNFGHISIGTDTFSDFIRDSYLSFKGRPLFGVLQYQKPILVIRDLELIRQVAVKDFDHFTDHQKFFSKKLNPLLSQNLFNLDGQEWRDMRATLSPAFTSSKMRGMFKLIDACGEKIIKHLEKGIAKTTNGVLERDMKELFTRFTNDCIATSAFGIQVDSFNDPSNDFYAKGRVLTNTTGIRFLLFFGYLMSPKLMETLGLSSIPNSVLEYFHAILHKTMAERQKQGIFRPDMLQLLMQARAGELKVEKEDEHEKETVRATSEKKRLTDEDITSQALVFFFAGFDTVSTLMCWTALRLARHPDAQQRLQREIDEVVEARGGTFSYEAILEMKYLDMVINEVQRLHSGFFLDRLCVKDYTFPAKDGIPAFTVRKGELIWFPQHGLHHDPEYWSEPNKFDPERFSEENRSLIKPFTFMPFGVGPRLCIGSRFAVMETKIVLVHILRHFSFVPSPKTPKELKFAKFDANFTAEGGFWVGIEKRQD